MLKPALKNNQILRSQQVLNALISIVHDNQRYVVALRFVEIPIDWTFDKLKKLA
jgi:hypothetical protein